MQTIQLPWGAGGGGGGGGGSDHNIFIQGGPIPRSTLLYTIFDRKGTHYWAGNNFMLLKSVEVLK